MSLGELAITAIAALVCLRPQDAPYIMKVLKRLKRETRKLIAEVENAVFAGTDQDLQESNEQSCATLNLYIAKIVELGGRYEGEYSMRAIKKYYYSLLRNSVIENSQ